MTPDHCDTALAAVSLSLTGLEEGDLPHPLNRANLQRLRDALEIATMLPDLAPRLIAADLETICLCLTATRGVLHDRQMLIGPPDMLAALTLPQVDAALEHLNITLASPPRLALTPLTHKGDHDA